MSRLQPSYFDYVILIENSFYKLCEYFNKWLSVLQPLLHSKQLVYIWRVGKNQVDKLIDARFEYY